MIHHIPGRSGSILGRFVSRESPTRRVSTGSQALQSRAQRRVVGRHYIIPGRQHDAALEISAWERVEACRYAAQVGVVD